MLDKLREDILQIVDTGAEQTLEMTHGLKLLRENADGVVEVEIYLADPKAAYANDIKNTIVRLVKLNYGYKGIKYKATSLKEKDTILERSTRFLCIASGKGGVGKSTVTANLALALSRMGYKVGIIDADIYGASLANIFEEHGEVMADEEGKIIPLEKEGIEFMSTSFFTEDKPLMWRGPLLSKMLQHYFYDTKWSKDLDFMLIDLPPGTGDVAIDIAHIAPKSKYLVVTTPHKSASNIAVKAGLGAKEMNIEIIGVVENMAFFPNSVNGQKEYIFGKGGGDEVALKLQTDVLAQIPLGQPTGIYHSLFVNDEDDITNIYDELAYRVAQRF